mmetsp:Transcript_19161/g.41385  ORF Transcript_19161/g.41385 Transcript_19161/m.41385 type:complete len:710 (+) Transcript_19161:50-2179(+)|eukprot:CAMPEP_0202894828 /NCGR_PEP_ID=MMETSP1392-20130828/4135_1 /ASSEMBLY_ACC=CAM_ASM_000868 /TAXON_ID=225041 /ORGANISM="Chlamydomonas chlamydogama, Strain SAG 11-48b" /LENGTH=709 /DNA_ID=CAMNT_0049579631 /DNA_START=44 /DNA_END=2173 /DNA_ORIENTATION=+
MSTRHLRRLQEQLQQQKAAPQQDSEESEDEEEEETSTKAPFNPFDLLSDDEANDVPGEPSEEEEQDAPTCVAQAPPAVKATQPAAGDGRNKKNGKKKAAKKSKGKSAKPEESDEEELPSSSHDAGGVDDIDRLVQELNLKTVGAMADSKGHAKAAAAPLLGVDLRGLRGDDELRRIFGADVVQSVDREDMAEAANRRRAVGAARGMAPGRRRPLKKGLLVAPKEHWPPFEGGLSMEICGVKDGRQLFRYRYSPSYRTTQGLFEQCQATYDPNSIAALLQQAPYHVDSLLTMYDLYRHTGDNQYAEEVLARALYSLEMGWHLHFNIGSGSCRLDYEVEENRALFVALFRHIQALSRQGCHRTALECCKLLLALDPEDPMGALMLVDYLCLRAGKYEYLHRFIAEFEGNRSLALLPNYAYAAALARFRQEQQQEAAGQAPDANLAERVSSGAAAGTSSGSSSSAAAELGQWQRQQPALHLMVQAVLLFPMMVPRLLAKLQEKGSGKEAAWTSLLARKLFASAGDNSNASLGHLVNIYVERSHMLWKAPDALELLRKASSSAADVAEGTLAKRTDGGQVEAAAAAGGLGAEDWACVQRESFPANQANEYRHLRLHDFSDNVNALPREELQAAMQAGGPAEVEDLLAELQEQMMLAQQQGQPAGGRAMSEEELRNANPIMMLLRSLLPWVNAGQQPDYGAPEGGDGPPPQQQG